MAPDGRQEGRLEGIIGHMRVRCRNILVDGRINRLKIFVEGLSWYMVCVGTEKNGAAKW